MYHPDLAARARWMPRGVGRRWALPLLRGATRFSAAMTVRDCERVELDGFRVFVRRPASASAEPQAALLWIHGGGLVMGDARQDDHFARRIVDELGITVASVQYRLSPSNPFPTPLHDCAQAFAWLAAQPEIDAARISVGGQSAGAGLAAALCQLQRDEGSTQPAFQLLIYPMLDDRSATGSGPNDDWFRLWDRPSNALGWSSYLGGLDRESLPAHAVPGRTADLAGLPPAWIGVGTLDLFHDEDLDYARRLEAAGVEVELEVVDGAYHGFEIADPDAPVSKRFSAAQLAALAAHTEVR